MRVLLFLFILFPVLELAVLIKVGSAIGVLPTLLLLAVSALAGGYLLRIAGPITAWRARARLLGGGPPEEGKLDGPLLGLGGVLLLLPGFISDFFGLLCLLPFTRHLLRQRLGRQAARRADAFTAARQTEGEAERPRPQVIEGEWQRHDD